MRALLLVPFFCLAAAVADAGPWPRDPGRGFLSTGAAIEGLPYRREHLAEVTDAADLKRAIDRLTATEIYGEYGMTARLAFAGHLRRAERQVRSDLLARWHPVLPAAIGRNLALGLTIGLRVGGGQRPAPILGLHLGRGAETAAGNFWTRFDLQAVGDRQGVRGVAELTASAQVGLRTGWGGLAMLTLSEHRTGLARTLKATPALGYALTPRSTVVLGATLLPRSRQIDGMQLSLWHDF